MNYENARANMIEQQIRPWNVLEMQTLAALNDIRREDFVPAEYRNRAFVDIQIPMTDGEVMLEPKVGARMVEAMSLTENKRVLEIGTGTGYLTALMAVLCDEVTSLEINAELATISKTNLAMAGIQNTRIIETDCFSYLNDTTEQFDAILITGSVLEIDHLFLKAISDNGCIVGIHGNDPAMRASIVSKQGEVKTLFETSVPRLKNVKETPSFSF